MADDPSRQHQDPPEHGIVRVTPVDLGLAEEGGEAACYAHLVCPECGWVVTEGHRPGCSEAPGERGASGQSGVPGSGDAAG